MAQEEQDVVGLDTELLAQLEADAASRYTEDDTDFMEHYRKGLPKPPILPAERFDRNRQRRDNFRHQDHRRGGRGGDYRDHRRDKFGGGHRDYDDGRRDNKRKYGSDRQDNEYGRRDYEAGKYQRAGSSY